MKTAIITDLHAEEEFPSAYGADVWRNWKQILEDVEKRGIREIIFLGDIGSNSAHERLLDTIQPFDFRLVLGNHDKFDELSKSYLPDFVAGKKEWYWSEVRDTFKRIFLDTSSNSISEVQLNFLKQEIQTDQSILLFIHHPVLQTNTTPQLEFPLSGADQIMQILSRHGKPVHIYCGHLHLDDVIIEGNITQTVTPASSVQIKRNSPKAEIEHIDFAYRILDLEDMNLESEVIWFKVETK